MGAIAGMARSYKGIRCSAETGFSRRAKSFPVSACCLG